MLAYLAAGMVFVTNQINSYTYGYTGAFAGIAAGLYFMVRCWNERWTFNDESLIFLLILQAIPLYFWTIYFGTDPDSLPHRLPYSSGVSVSVPRPSFPRFRSERGYEGYSDSPAVVAALEGNGEGPKRAKAIYSCGLRRSGRMKALISVF